MQRREWISAAACAASVLHGGLAVAAEPAGAVSSAPAAELPADDAGNRAAAAFDRAMKAYEARDLTGALSAMRESYRLSGRSELLYNVARLEQELGACPEALADYQRYIDALPDGRYVEVARQARDELAARCPVTPASPPATQDEPRLPPRAETPAPPAPLSSPAVEPMAGSGPRPLALIGWSAIAVGVAAEVSALYFNSRAVDAHDRLKAGVESEYAGGPLVDYQGLLDEQDRNVTWARVLAVGGGALLAGGVVLVVLSPGQAPRAPAKTTLAVTPGLGLRLSHVF